MEVEIKQLVKALLKHYSLKEESLKNNGYAFVNKYEGSSDLTTFEMLSSSNAIILLTKLSDVDCRVVLLLLQSILTDNYYWLEDYKGLYEDFFNEQFDGDIEEAYALLEKYETSGEGFKLWIEMLSYHCGDDESYVIKENPDKIIDEYLHEKWKSFPQQILTVDKIHTNLRITISGIVEIYCE